jgi:Fur family peroxide stress response transcriptional regulator
MFVNEAMSFREVCQRQVLYKAMKKMHGPPNPGEVDAQVEKRVPAVSLATVHKNIHLFVKSGVFREVSLHHASLRMAMNDESHHDVVCSKCKAIS